MITFFAITTIFNLALGYGLAIYLGHARPILPGTAHPGPAPVGQAVSPRTPSPGTSDVATARPSTALASELEPPSLPGIPAPGLPGLVSPLQSSDPQGSSETSNAADGHNPADADNRQVPTVDRTSVDSPNSTADGQTNDSSQPPSEEDLLAGIAAFRAQLSSVNSATDSENQSKVNTNVSLNQGTG